MTEEHDGKAHPDVLRVKSRRIFAELVAVERAHIDAVRLELYEQTEE